MCDFIEIDWNNFWSQPIRYSLYHMKPSWIKRSRVRNARTRPKISTSIDQYWFSVRRTGPISLVLIFRITDKVIWVGKSVLRSDDTGILGGFPNQEYILYSRPYCNQITHILWLIIYSFSGWNSFKNGFEVFFQSLLSKWFRTCQVQYAQCVLVRKLRTRNCSVA